MSFSFPFFTSPPLFFSFYLLLTKISLFFALTPQASIFRICAVRCSTKLMCQHQWFSCLMFKWTQTKHRHIQTHTHQNIDFFSLKSVYFNKIFSKGWRNSWWNVNYKLIPRTKWNFIRNFTVHYKTCKMKKLF